MQKWKSLWVNVHPQVVKLTEWRVYELDEEHCHVVGLVVEHESRRTSMPVQILHGPVLEAVSAKGYRYILTGEPGPGADEDAELTWIRNSMIHSAVDWTDVTDRVWGAHTENDAGGTLIPTVGAQATCNAQQMK